jgi:hypothetical protein
MKIYSNLEQCSLRQLNKQPQKQQIHTHTWIGWRGGPRSRVRGVTGVGVDGFWRRLALHCT